MHFPRMKRFATHAMATAWGLSMLTAGDLDTIGLTSLLAREPGLTGSGVTIAMAEASLTPNGTVYQASPETASQDPAKFTFFDASTTYPVSAGFSAAKESWHANSVAGNFFGPSGVAAGVDAIKIFDANYFFYTIVGNGTNIGAPIVNQSFIFREQIPAIDSSYDNYSDFYKVLFVNGVNNGSATLPPSPATMYNGIAVGLANGGGSAGPTATGGRSKPDIVAPSSLTSFATPYVSGAAALLIQAGARGDGGTGTAASAVDPRTLKALLLNGAVKPAGWTRQGSEPLDRRYGAGVLNVNRSHLQLSGGRHSPTTSVSYTSGAAHLPPTAISGNVTSLTGWNNGTIQNARSGSTFKDRVDHYFFDLPSSQSGAFHAVCTLVWNRQNGQSGINNLDLFLYDATTNALVSSSASGVDNVEHLSLSNLPAGRYVLQVFKPESGSILTNFGTSSIAEPYALAFDFSAVPPPLPPTGLVVTPISSSAINLTWTDASPDETGFRILRSESPSSGFVEIGNIAAGTFAFSDMAATAGTTYFYQVSSYSLAGDSAPATGSTTTFSVLQSWRNDYFQTIASEGDAADAMDFDDDGLANLVEYALGTDPLVTTPPSSAPTAKVESDGVDSYLTLTVTRSDVRPGVTYAVEVGSDLVGWSEDVTILENTNARLKVRDNTALTSGVPKRFARLRVTSP